MFQRGLGVFQYDWGKGSKVVGECFSMVRGECSSVAGEDFSRNVGDSILE